MGGWERMNDRQYPDWYCQRCGKLLRLRPCLNCRQRTMSDEEFPYTGRER